MKDSLRNGSLRNGSLWLAWRQQRVLVGAGAALLAAAAAIAVYSRSGMLDALHSGLFDHCGTGPLYCTRPDTGLPVLLDTDPLKYLGMLNIALPVLIGVFWGAPLLGRVRGRSHTLSRAAGTGRRRTVGGTAMALAGHRRGAHLPLLPRPPKHRNSLGQGLDQGSSRAGTVAFDGGVRHLHAGSGRACPHVGGAPARTPPEATPDG